MATIPLSTLIGDLDPTKCKLHCAVFNGKDHPIDVLARSSKEWMQWSRWRPATDAFNRQFIFTLAQERDRSTRWLFGGVFEVVNRRLEPLAHSYDLVLRDDLMGPFIKRLEVSFKAPGRQMRLNFDTYLDSIEVMSIREHAYAGEAFPGLNKINHTFGTLEVAIEQGWHDWRGALQGMKGVYVIHDQETGKEYVGSAYGDTGIWSRLSEYVARLHGGNKGLVELVGEKGPEYAKANLRFALLDYWSMQTPDEDVLKRESYWKDVLLSRKFGNNKN
ncbi:GIY-YIG nuclease family protein [Mycobacterium neglectum]|uniref:GIY-YIG nuclease family protein n=1 Tax=Mycobacterium neglectum TaxID=242737 RepID=UPI000BFEAF19|nr:GIY-YIG nuclease family protein [Mycobacterium neglectum]